MKAISPLNQKTAAKKNRPERIVQFGEGNFLRGFADWIISVLDEETDFDSSVVIVQPRNTKGKIEPLNRQDGLYHVNLQGIENGRPVNSFRMIDVVSRAISPYSDFDLFLRLAEQEEIKFVISNTTEAGIVFDPTCLPSDRPASSYPGKLVQFLYHRYRKFEGDMDRGLVILPCELVYDNGQRLREAIDQYMELWQLEEGFRTWFNTSCRVYSTLVDRIVSGFPLKEFKEIQERLDYADHLLVQGEIYHQWVIEAPVSLTEIFPVHKTGLNILLVPSEKPYHQRKVTLLNGAHTALSPVAYLCGADFVDEACKDPDTGSYIRHVMYEELIATLNQPMEELKTFADQVMNRFLNPYLSHRLTSIMLNAFSKYRTRDLPALKTYLEKKGELPEGLVIGLAALMVYYRGGTRKDGSPIRPDDAGEIQDLLQKAWNLPSCQETAEAVLSAEQLWEEDLTRVPKLTEKVASLLESILDEGMRSVVKKFIAR